MKKYYDIAVIGESMSGKSTLIASMFAEEAAAELVKVCEGNKSGQTKLAAHYSLLVQEQPLRVDAVRWNQKELADCLRAEEGGSLAKELEKFGFPDAVGYKESEFLEELGKYLESEPYKAKISAMDFGTLMDFINDGRLCDANLVSCVELSGGANEQIQEIMRQKGVKYLKLRDTKGFLDESPEKMKQALEESADAGKEKTPGMAAAREGSEAEKIKYYVEKQLMERGLSGELDACIFLSISASNALHKDICREIYGEVLGSLISSQPTALVIRDSRMTDALDLAEVETDVTGMVEGYNKALEFILGRRTFTGFDNFETLVEEYAVKQEKSYMTELLEKNRKQYILADISKGMQGENFRETSGRIYRQSVVGLVADLLDDMERYHGNIAVARECEEKLGKYEGEAFDEIFARLFEKDITYYENGYGLQRYLRYYPWYIYNIIKESNSFQGGLVGPRNGLTTRKNGRMVGEEAINLMEGAYRIRGDVFGEYIRENEPKVRKVMNEMDLGETVNGMLANIWMLYQRKLHERCESLSCTGPMVPREYLENAYYEVKRLLELESDAAKKYFQRKKPEHISGHDKEWQRDCRGVMTVWALLYLMAK